MGDPTADCISIIITRDGGQTWNKIPCSQLPKSKEGEAAFAASNTILPSIKITLGLRQEEWLVEFYILLIKEKPGKSLTPQSFKANLQLELIL